MAAEMWDLLHAWKQEFSHFCHVVNSNKNPRRRWLTGILTQNYGENRNKNPALSFSEPQLWGGCGNLWEILGREKKETSFSVILQQTLTQSTAMVPLSPNLSSSQTQGSTTSAFLAGFKAPHLVKNSNFLHRDTNQEGITQNFWVSTS